MTTDPIAAALLESDRMYFELGARVEPLDGAVLAWVPGMQRAPAACVVQRVADGLGPIAAEPRQWVTEVTERLTTMGCSVARVYVDSPAPDLEVALAEAGFRRRVEIGYVWPGHLPGGRADVSLRPILTEADWAAKVALHAGEQEAVDGHALSAESWVELERAKCDGGQMQAYLIEVEGDVCGAIAGIRVDGLLRAKNVFVRADRRREGIGSEAMSRMTGEAVAEGRRATGIFGVEGKPGNALYRNLGMTPKVERIEWSRPL
ncbi:MAG: GNAT family N-acetyltransferase [Actinomycetota bacterium]|nr:GNAT family N-acetyltransferase [Actinomycetota bacterium]